MRAPQLARHNTLFSLEDVFSLVIDDVPARHGGR